MATDCRLAEGYHIQTRSSRLVPGTGARVSSATASTQCWIARPTGNDPVGVGSVTSDLRSSQRNPKSAPSITTPNDASAAKPLGTRGTNENSDTPSSEVSQRAAAAPPCAAELPWAHDTSNYGQELYNTKHKVSRSRGNILQP